MRPVGATRFGATQRLEQADGVAASAPALVQGDGRGAVLAWVGGDPGAPADPERREHARARIGHGRRRPLRRAAAAVARRPAGDRARRGGQRERDGRELGADRAGARTSSGQVFAALRPVGGAFGAPEAASPDEHAGEHGAGLHPDADNRPLVLWTARPGGEGPGVPIASIKTFVRTAQRQP